jgi:phage terminase small subunit
MDAPEKEIKMTDKQKKFCEEYLIDLNATQAAIRAGYSEDSARQIGTDTLSKTYIRKYIDEQLEIGNQQRIRVFNLGYGK